MIDTSYKSASPYIHWSNYITENQTKEVNDCVRFAQNPYPTMGSNYKILVARLVELLEFYQLKYQNTSNELVEKGNAYLSLENELNELVDKLYNEKITK